MENMKKEKGIRKEICSIYPIKVPKEKSRQNREETIFKESYLWINENYKSTDIRSRVNAKLDKYSEIHTLHDGNSENTECKAMTKHTQK